MQFRENLEKMAEIYGGIAIFSVQPGSTTHRAGVRSGDILVAVNGRAVRRLSDYAAARARRRELLELSVVRDGRFLTLWAGDAALGASGAASSERAAAAPEASAHAGSSVTCSWRGHA